MRSRPALFLAALLALAPLPGRFAPAVLAAQATPAPSAPVPPPAARPADVASLDAIIAALYDVISGPAGQRRDWDRMRSLFVPGARLIPTGRRPDSTRTMRVMTVEDYITMVGPRLEEGGFFEREIGRRTEQYGAIVHLMSAYDSKRSLSDAAPFARGVNSIQAWHDGKRWWIVTIYWESERPDNPIPPRFLERPGS